MELSQAIILGAIQGLTEFLPISSSGHLVLFQKVLGLDKPEIFLDICLHLGTLMAIVVVFYGELKATALALVSLLGRSRNKDPSTYLYEKGEVRLVWLIILGMIPTGVIGLLFHLVVQKIFSSILLVGIMLMITGILLWLTRRVKVGTKDISRVSGWDAMVIGAVQGLAAIPGISRSGSTIAVGLFLGMDRQTASCYSFLLSVPAIIGAAIIEFDYTFAGSVQSIMPILAGTIVAAGVGYFALKVLLRMIKRGDLYRFAPYCWLVGVVAILSSFST
nr:undecaprenyl-diphosphate phosphatase [Desulfobacterales bacterium]